MKGSSPKQEFNNIGQRIVQHTDLPLSCPPPDMAVSNAHPRVYLPIEQTGQATCPYCSAQYLLKDPKGSDVE